MARKVIQIAATQTRVGDVHFSTLVALCDDGALLQYSPRSNPPWTIFPAVPGPEVQLEEVNPHTRIDAGKLVADEDAGEEHA